VSVRLPRLQNSTPITDRDGRPSLPFQRYWQSFAEQIERTINTIASILGITEELEQALQQAQAAIVIAQDAAATAQEAVAAQGRETALQSSTIDPSSVLTATVTDITIAPHTRMYGDGTSAPVTGATITATASGDTDYVFYDDPDREGGAVAYQVTTTQPIQSGDRHVVGAVTIPATGTAEGGDGPRPPGYVAPRLMEGPEP
jgi:hypothetical protein